MKFVLIKFSYKLSAMAYENIARWQLHRNALFTQSLTHTGTVAAQPTLTHTLGSQHVLLVLLLLLLTWCCIN